ncbi:hypothetical protein AB837_00025 [bacterium AB1]|nr:hypothetical protein AB837_00025 [bacterium AB1]
MSQTNKNYSGNAIVYEIQNNEQNNNGILANLFNQLKRPFRNTYPTDVRYYANRIVAAIGSESIYIFRNFEEEGVQKMESMRLPFAGDVQNIDYNPESGEFVIYYLVNDELIICYVKNNNDEDNVTYTVKNLQANIKRKIDSVCTSKNFIVTMTHGTRDLHIIPKSLVHRSFTKDISSSTTLTASSYAFSFDDHILHNKKITKNMFGCLSGNLRNPSKVSIAAMEKEEENELWIYIVENQTTRVEIYDTVTQDYKRTEILHPKLITKHIACLVMHAHQLLNYLNINIGNIENVIVGTDGKYFSLAYNLYSGSKNKRNYIFYLDQDGKIVEVANYDLKTNTNDDVIHTKIIECNINGVPHFICADLDNNEKTYYTYNLETKECGDIVEIVLEDQQFHPTKSSIEAWIVAVKTHYNESIIEHTVLNSAVDSTNDEDYDESLSYEDVNMLQESHEVESEEEEDSEEGDNLPVENNTSEEVQNESDNLDALDINENENDDLEEDDQDENNNSNEQYEDDEEKKAYEYRRKEIDTIGTITTLPQEMPEGQSIEEESNNQENDYDVNENININDIEMSENTEN